MYDGDAVNVPQKSKETGVISFTLTKKGIHSQLGRGYLSIVKDSRNDTYADDSTSSSSADNSAIKFINEQCCF